MRFGNFENEVRPAPSSDEEILVDDELFVGFQILKDDLRLVKLFDDQVKTENVHVICQVASTWSSKLYHEFSRTTVRKQCRSIIFVAQHDRFYVVVFTGVADESGNGVAANRAR